ncbi:hypothetical protein Y032_0005g2518 [Ancylostoma ceylanicum]|uniref:Uncharacterized protein n=1 Tax=Ancylostoma ceylanicum TaxID=53326 RepID=A0A016VS22_9BILA|nr:hypothetical protein Y032_0005g2518 [Ancylostoma ceylanicum]
MSVFHTGWGLIVSTISTSSWGDDAGVKECGAACHRARESERWRALYSRNRKNALHKPLLWRVPNNEADNVVIGASLELDRSYGEMEDSKNRLKVLMEVLDDILNEEEEEEEEVNDSSDEK